MDSRLSWTGVDRVWKGRLISSCDCRTKVCAEIGHSVDQLAGGVVVVKGEVNQLVVHTAICICEV